jgi:hypothetical protein
MKTIDTRPMIGTAIETLQAMDPVAVERLLAVVAEIVIRLLDRDGRGGPGNSPGQKAPEA